METRDKVHDNGNTHESSPCQPTAGQSDMQAKEVDDVRYYYSFHLFFFGIYKNHIKYMNNVCLNLTMKSTGFCEQV